MTKKAALVTGGSGGIGLAIARRLAENGYHLTISGRREDKLLNAAEELANDDFKVEAVVADLSTPNAVVELVAEHRRQWGRMDCLVNNAGIGIGQPIESVEDKYFDLQVAVNLRAMVMATRESFGMLREAGGEHGKALILNLSSIAGKMYPAWLSVYAATKAAVISFSQSTQKEFADSGVQVTAIAPGFVATDMTEFAQQEIPAGEMITVADLAEAVDFLLRLSPNCVVPELVLNRAGSGPDTAGM